MRQKQLKKLTEISGMVLLTPQTREGNWIGLISGYIEFNEPKGG